MSAAYEKFYKLGEEKQKRMITAALKEFSTKGYKEASTIEIAKEAGISKGLLFHYFNTKIELFLFLYDYSIEILKSEYFSLINTGETDIFLRLRQVYLLKIELIYKYPYLFEFSAVASATDAEELKGELDSRKRELLALGYEKMFEDNDDTRFIEGSEVERVKNVIYWALGGFANKILEEVKTSGLNYDYILEEFDAYLKILKDAFYKKS